MTIRFNKNFDFRYATPEPVAPDVVRVVARNPKDYTFKGTNSYLIGDEELACIDPGPLLDEHLAALDTAIAGRPLKAIFVTHSHLDHSPAAHALAARTGATVYAHSAIDPELAAATDEDVDLEFRPHVTLGDGESVTGKDWRITAVHTPGHFPNHNCYSLEGSGILFSGDQVMGWSTTVISPPLGDLAEYLASLERLLGRDDRRYLPSHGPDIPDPGSWLRALIAHRAERERQIVECLSQGFMTPAEIVECIYTDLTPRLVLAARQSVRAHLELLRKRGLIAGYFERKRDKAHSA